MSYKFSAQIAYNRTEQLYAQNALLKRWPYRINAKPGNGHYTASDTFFLFYLKNICTITKFVHFSIKANEIKGGRVYKWVYKFFRKCTNVQMGVQINFLDTFGRPKLYKFGAPI